MTHVKEILKKFPQIISVADERETRNLRRDYYVARRRATPLTALDRLDVEAATRGERFDLELFNRVMAARGSDSMTPPDNCKEKRNV